MTLGLPPDQSAYKVKRQVCVSRRFFAYYPGNSSPAGVLSDILASMFNVIGFSWEASPAATELEIIVLGEPLMSAFPFPLQLPVSAEEYIFFS